MGCDHVLDRGAGIRAKQNIISGIIGEERRLRNPCLLHCVEYKLTVVIGGVFYELLICVRFSNDVACLSRGAAGEH